jgi:hypothetical protein
MKPPIVQILLLGIFAAALISWTIYGEIDYHYLEAYNGIVIKKLQIPPKKMPDLVIKGTATVFPCWKWEGIDFDSVKVGDSVVKRKYEGYAYYYKKLGNGQYIKTRLEYW